MAKQVTYIDAMEQEKLPLLQGLAVDDGKRELSGKVLRGYLEFVNYAATTARIAYMSAAWLAAEKWTKPQMTDNSALKSSFTEEAISCYEEFWNTGFGEALLNDTFLKTVMPWDEKYLKAFDPRNWNVVWKEMLRQYGNMEDDDISAAVMSGFLASWTKCALEVTKSDLKMYYPDVSRDTDPWDPAADEQEARKRKQTLQEKASVINMWMFPDGQEVHSALWFGMTSDNWVEKFLEEFLLLTDHNG